MSWNPYYATYLGQRSGGREQSTLERPFARDPRGGQPVSPRVPPRDPRRPDPRVTTPPFPQQPDPRVTTRPEDLRPHDDRHDHDDRRHPRHHHHDYTYVANYGWWPSWFPYWDPYWFWYWQYLYWYYRGYENPEYAEWARDAVLRSMARERGWM
jgi:hypothetical protein